MEPETLPLDITPEDWARTPPAVQQAVMTLVDMVRELSAQVQQQRVELQELRRQLHQTSHNSSKPPSSDPPSAPPRANKPRRGRPKGAQGGHADQQRAVPPPDQIDQIVVLRPAQCDQCHAPFAHDLAPLDTCWVTHTWELPPVRPIITEYRQQAICCPHCQQTTLGTPPPSMPPGAFGPRLTALMGLLHGRYRLSMRETSHLLADVYGVPVSVGSIARSCGRISSAIAPIDAAIHATIEQQDVLWVDETGWREAGQRCWLWVAVSPRHTCFRIDRRRSGAMLRSLIGSAFRGVVHADRASAYHVLPDHQRQLCLAHVLRNLHAMVDQPGGTARWADALLTQFHALFSLWHRAQEGWCDQITLQQATLPIRTTIHALLTEGSARGDPHYQRFCHDLLRHWDALWTFVRHDQVEPTNNRAERALRPAVVWRKSCFGTQSADGSRFVERMLSVSATCQQQGRQLFAFLIDAIRAVWAGQSPPFLTSP